MSLLMTQKSENKKKNKKKLPYFHDCYTLVLGREVVCVNDSRCQN